MRGRLGLLVSSLAGGLLVAAAASANERAGDENTRAMTREEIEAWLDAAAVNRERDVGPVEAVPEAPPPAPRQHGLVLEAAVGGVGHLSTLKYVSPTSPEFRLIVGYEVIDPLLLFVDAGMFISSTRYARRPPDPRTYAYYAFGGGARFAFDVSESLGLYLEGSAGMGTATEDVLMVYGYQDSAELNFYFGGQIGCQWFQVNPHYALALYAGLRDYLGLARERSSDAPLVVNAGAAIKYTF